MMEDFKSSFRSMIPYLARNFIRYFPGDQIRGLMLRRMLAELKVTASRIRPIQLYDIPGLAGVSVISTLHGGAVVALLAKARRARFIFEFGTYTGATTMEIALNCPDAEIVTLDLPETMEQDFNAAAASCGAQVTDRYLFKSPRGSLIQGEPAKRIRQLRQDSATFDPQPYANKVDLIYVDASHSYSAVREDTQKALAMCAPGGMIVWDDYWYPGVWRYLNELAEADTRLPLRYIYDWNKVILAT